MNSQLYDAAFVNLGITKSNNLKNMEMQHTMISIFSEALSVQADWRLANNKPPMTLTEKKKIVNDITMFHYQTAKGANKRVTPFGDNNSEEVGDVLFILGDNGVAISARSADAVEKLLEMDLPTTTNTIEAAMRMRRQGKLVNKETLIMTLRNRGY